MTGSASIYGQLQSILNKLGMNHDTAGTADVIQGSQHGKLQSSGGMSSCHPNPSGVKGDKKGSTSKSGPTDTLENDNTMSAALQALQVPNKPVLP